MGEGRLARWSPAAGLVFVALFIVAALLSVDVPGAGSTDAKIESYYRDHGNDVRLEIAYFVATLAAVFFLWFVGHLSMRLRLAQDEPSWPSPTVLVSGGAFTS